MHKHECYKSYKCYSCKFATAAAAQNRFRTHLLVPPLLQLLPSLHSVNDSISYNGIQLLRQENVAIAGAAPASSERTFKVHSHSAIAAAIFCVFYCVAAESVHTVQMQQWYSNAMSMQNTLLPLQPHRIRL